MGFRAEEGTARGKQGHQPSSRLLVMGHRARFKGKLEIMVKAEAIETDLGHQG